MVRFDHVGVVVDDLDAVAAFFVGLGFERDGGMLVEGEAVDKINGLDGVRADIVMVRTPDGSGTLELVKYRTPADTGGAQPWPANREPLAVRQWIELDVPDPTLLRGVERYFETVSALAAQGRVDRFGRIKDPLQEAVTLTATLVPGTWFAGVPIGLQRALLEWLAALGRRRGRVAEPSPR